MKKLLLFLSVTVILSACGVSKNISVKDITGDHLSKNNIKVQKTVENKHISENDDLVNKKQNTKKQNCIVKMEKVTVQGTSMTPLIKNGDILDVMVGYQRCHNLKRGDIIIYNYAGNKLPLIKQIKGIGGDKFSLKQNGNYWNILINDKVVKNSQGKLYSIPNSKIGILKLYSKSYPIIPKDTYLILGNNIYGTMDSTMFGLISKNDIYGVIKK